MTRAPRAAWIPAFVVGACLASVAELAVGLLVYAGPGLLRSVTTVLAVEAAALAIGLWSAPTPGPELFDVLRRRWLTCLVSFLVATVFAAAWGIVGVLAGTALGQGLGLATLAALPLYAGGALLGGLSAVDPGRPTSMVISRASLGAVLGFLLTGAALTRVLTPSSLMLACIILLSAAGLVYSHVQDGILRIDVKRSLPSPFGEVRVEERVLPVAGPAVRALVEGHTLRRWTITEDEGITPWDLTVLRALSPAPSEPFRVLCVGGGVSPMPGMGVREHPLVDFEVTERSAAAVELARELFDTGTMVEDGGRMALSVGNLDDLTEGRGSYDLVCVDLAALGTVGGSHGLSARTRRALVGRLSDGAVLAFGPLPLPAGAWCFPEGSVAREFRRVVDAPLDRLFVGVSREEVVTLVTREPGGGVDLLPGFRRREPLA